MFPEDTFKMLMLKFKGRILPHRHFRTVTAAIPATVTPSASGFAQIPLQLIKLPPPHTHFLPLCSVPAAAAQVQLCLQINEANRMPTTLLPSYPSKTLTARLGQGSSPLWLPSAAINSTYPEQPLRVKIDGMRTKAKPNHLGCSLAAV